MQFEFCFSSFSVQLSSGLVGFGGGSARVLFWFWFCFWSWSLHHWVNNISLSLSYTLFLSLYFRRWPRRGVWIVGRTSHCDAFAPLRLRTLTCSTTRTTAALQPPPLPYCSHNHFHTVATTIAALQLQSLPHCSNNHCRTAATTITETAHSRAS